jgi:hypothetical protein
MARGFVIEGEVKDVKDVVVVSRGFPVKGVSVEKRAHTGKRKQSC